MRQVGIKEREESTAMAKITGTRNFKIFVPDGRLNLLAAEEAGASQVIISYFVSPVQIGRVCPGRSGAASVPSVCAVFCGYLEGYYYLLQTC